MDTVAEWRRTADGGYLKNTSYLIVIRHRELGIRIIDIGSFQYDPIDDEFYWNYALRKNADFKVTHFASLPAKPEDES